MIDDEKMLGKPQLLLDEVKDLAKKPEERKKLAEKLHEEAKLDSARKLADIVLAIGEKKNIENVEKKRKA